MNQRPALMFLPMRRRSPADGTLFGRATCDRVTSCPRMRIWLVLLKMKASSLEKVMAKTHRSQLLAPNLSLQHPPAAAAGPVASSDLSECAGLSQRNSTWRIFVWISKIPDRVGWWPSNHWPHHHSMMTSPLNYPQKQSNDFNHCNLLSVCIYGLFEKCWLICAKVESFSESYKCFSKSAKL